MPLSNNVFPSSSAFERHFYQDLADTDEVATNTYTYIHGVIKLYYYCYYRTLASLPHGYYAALLPRRGPHIASHSVCPSVCLSVCPSVPLSSVTWRQLANYNDTLRAAYRTAISAAQTCLQLACGFTQLLCPECHTW